MRRLSFQSLAAGTSKATTPPKSTVTQLQRTNFYVFFNFFLVDMPDPYVQISFSGTPPIKECTEVKEEEVNPIWNEEFRFLLPSRVSQIKAKVCTNALFYSTTLTFRQCAQICQSAHISSFGFRRI